MKYIDLTHKFTNNMPLFPGDPEMELSRYSILEKNGINNSFLKSGLHVGTHIDAPWHLAADGKKLSEFPPEKFFGQGVLVQENQFTGQGLIALIYTGWDKKFSQPEYFENYPVINEDFAQQLIEHNISIVGFDTPSPDVAPYNIHKLLLAHDILILENLTNLDQLIGVPNFEVIALPPKLEADGAPVRVVARIA